MISSIRVTSEKQNKNVNIFMATFKKMDYMGYITFHSWYCIYRTDRNRIKVYQVYHFSKVDCWYWWSIGCPGWMFMCNIMLHLLLILARRPPNNLWYVICADKLDRLIVASQHSTWQKGDRITIYFSTGWRGVWRKLFQYEKFTLLESSRLFWRNFQPE